MGISLQSARLVTAQAGDIGQTTLGGPCRVSPIVEFDVDLDDLIRVDLHAHQARCLCGYSLGLSRLDGCA